MNGFTAVLDENPASSAGFFYACVNSHIMLCLIGRQDRSLRQLLHWKAHPL
jgi:hypothetical protein